MESLFRPFPLPLTPRQMFYLGFLQGVGAGFIDGGANFAVAYAMYNSQKTVKMWVFNESTLAGDLGVTPIVQCIASMIITSTLVHTDLHHHAIAPLPFVYPHVDHLPDPRKLFQNRDKRISPASDPEKVQENPDEIKRGTLSYYYWMLIRFIFEGTEKNMMLARIPVANWFGRLVWTAAQGAAIGIVFGFPIWCLAVIILGPIYGTGNVGNRWAPQIIKAVYGAVVGWITNPVIATLALGSQAECHLLVVEHDVEEAEAQPAVPTIMEDEEFIAPPSLRRPSTIPISPGLSPSRGLSTLPVSAASPSLTTRSRSGSNASRTSRPPLTANVSYLSPLPTSSSLPTEGILSVRQRSSSIVTTVRPRGATVSSYNSNRSYSYALGGTGGRAQRPRATSRASASGGIGGSGVPATAPPFLSDFGQMSSTARRRPSGSEQPPTAQSETGRPAVWDVFGRNESVPASAEFATPKKTISAPSKAT